MSRSAWCLVALILALAAGTAEAVTIRVPSDHLTIQAAVDAAASGDTVLVSSGYYGESILMKDGVALLGTGTDMPVIHGYGNAVTCLGTFGAGTRIEGFVLEGATSQHWSSGVFCDEDASVTIRYNVLRNNNMGVTLKEAEGHVVIEYNTIVNNRDCGIQLYNGDVPAPSGTSLIRNNIIAGNTLFGIWLGGGGHPPPLAPDMDYNDVWGNDQDYKDVQAGEHDISADPLFCGPEVGDYCLDTMSPCVGAGEMGTDIGALGIGCGASTVKPTTWGAIKAMYR